MHNNIEQRWTKYGRWNSIKKSYVVYLEYYSDIDIAKQADEGLMI